ncbi:hypothetical protein [Streptomyces fuscichromogenes]|uniref:Uncharacterized protein n=1 Tax=Streptomyces fuscichromogenes TaxID=1324013 RepID=A0A917XII0_9ACTN|nr:hypothetical protein [Streptomyces fuscichromogenes]GGN28979.1 hypothetical protein GCM10011578_065320 [Streptomyces fuscichromogenes]
MNDAGGRQTVIEPSYRQYWKPPEGEELVTRGRVSFATGAAGRVAGRRWFRDPERRDIQGELAGWPTGPSYRPRSRFERFVGDGVMEVLVLLLTLVFGLLGGSPGRSEGLGRSEDPENEEMDFPVLWAAPGTIARTLPWQLDPARRPDTDVTELVLTDRRLLFVEGLKDPRNPWEEVLWETDRDTVAAIGRRPFSDGGRDFGITFTDGSWCRLTSQEGESLLRGLAAA